MGAPHPVWKICLGQLGPNLQEAAELADVLQEVSAHIQVTGLTRTLTARTSTSSGNPTHLSTKERIRRAVPLNIDAGNVPWGQLNAVVSSAALQEPNSPAGRMQPQVLEVNSGGAVYFLFFKLKPPRQQQQQQQLVRQGVHQASEQQSPVLVCQHQQQHQPDTTLQPVQPAQQQAIPVQPGQQDVLQLQQNAGPVTQSQTQQSTSTQTAQQQQPQQQKPTLPLLQLHQQRSTAREGVAVLKVGASRLAMQAEQFANELTRHLSIAAPDCRIVRQVGSSAAEWSAVVAAVQQLAEPQQAAPTACAVAGSSTAAAAAGNTSAPASCPEGDKTAASPTAGSGGDAVGSGGSSGNNGGSSGCQVAAELLAELQHLPCFLLMEFVEGSKLSDCPQAVDPAVADVGQLCEDVGRLFLLDMLLGNADRMSCPELGWRGNANNLLYAQSGSRHAGRAVAIDSCVARRPPALKASAEDAAVERLSQLVLAVPGMSLALLQQLLGSLRQKQQLQQRQRRQVSLPGAVGLCSALSVESFHGSGSGQAGGFGSRLPSSAGGLVGPEPTSAAAAASEVEQSSLHKSPAAAAVAEDMAGVVQSPEQSTQPQLPVMGQARVCKTSLGGFRGQVGLQDAVELTGEAPFTEEEVARFQAGLRQCLDGVLQIKGLLEMVSAKIAEWIAEFVEDVVRQNPALLPTPASPGPGSLLRSPRPSPRVSGRGSFTNIRLEPVAHGTPSSCSSLGGVFDPVAAAGAGVAGTVGMAGSAHSPKGPAGAATGGGGSSFSSRLQAAAAAGGAGGSVPSPQQQQRQQSPEPCAGPHQSSPLARSPRGAPPAAGAAAAAASSEAEHGGTVPSSSAATSSSSSIAAIAGTPPKGTPPKGLFKQLVGGSKTTKTPQPLSRKFAAIKAAICSPMHSSNRSSTAFQQHPADPASPPPCHPSAGPADNPCTPPPAGPHGASGQLGSRSSDGKQQLQQQQQQCVNTPCSPSHSFNGSRSEPRSGINGTRSPLDRARSTSSDLATAVAAALSPRANAMQAEALAGVFGGRRSSGGLHRSFNGTVQQLNKGGLSFGGHSVGGHSAGGHSTGRHSLNSVTEWCESVGEGSEGKPLCARRVTWSASDESLVGAAGPFSNSGSGGTTSGGAVLKTAEGTSILEMPAVKAQGVSSSGGTGSTPPSEPLPVPSGWFNSSPSAGLPPAAAAKLAAIHSSNGASNSASTGNTANSSRNSSSSPVPAPAVQGAGQGVQPGQSSLFGVGPGKESGPPAHASPSPGGVDSFFNRAHNTRHLSFTSGGGAGYADGTSTSSNSPAGVAASMQAHHQQQQQRSSSSSLQVLASLQLDATLASITQEARHDGALAERLAHWKRAFREKGGELSAAIASWQERHQLAAVLSTGFLDGSHPIVDAYELGVRLQHMLRRLTALAAGALVQVPITVLPGVFLGNAVAADSHHLLQYLGVTHVLNAAQELQLTPDPGMFHVLRVAIRDEEEEDVTTHFHMAQSWIDAALASGGAVLVHCHEGKSRSVTLLLAYLMISRGMNLAAALAHMRAVHPKASPNAGFMAQLMRLDQQLHGSCSIQPSELPRAKPEARICSICGAAAGISYESLVRHTKAKHGLSQPPQASPAGSTASAPP